MGANFISACHRCKVFTAHFRSPQDVGKTLTRFYHDHYTCGKYNARNLQVYWDYIEEPLLEDLGYEDVFDTYYPEFVFKEASLKPLL